MSTNKQSYSSIRNFTKTISLQAAYNNKYCDDRPDYHVYLKHLFDDYLLQLDKDWSEIPFDPGHKITFSELVRQSKADATRLAGGIYSALMAYLHGNLYESTSIFNGIMDSFFSFLHELRVLHTNDTNRWDTFSFSSDSSHGDLYRIQKLDEGSVSVNMMRHPPFHMRQVIDTHRFSIPGCPCLYLGSSLFVCAREMGIDALPFPIEERSSKMKYHASQFLWKPEIDTPRLLELFLTPEHFAQYYEALADRFVRGKLLRKTDHQKFLRSYLVCWPLQLACSICVKYPKGKFKEEYIVPQLLMMWLKNQKHASFRCQ